MCHKRNSICLLWSCNAKNDQYYRGEYDEVKCLKTLIHGSEFQIRMGRENELLILSQKAINSPDC